MAVFENLKTYRATQMPRLCGLDSRALINDMFETVVSLFQNKKLISRETPVSSPL